MGYIGIFIFIVTAIIFYRVLVEEDDLGFDKVYVAIQALSCATAVFMVIISVWFVVFGPTWAK